jgi:UDP-N-acetylglucosamine--N-acetylmuramyl-(pentapeptide) pyrophosphoryl-undecaprenol N-acetylglucosamine transferase
MDFVYASDIIISRAGASSVSELSIVGKPVILFLLSNVKTIKKNAKAIVDKRRTFIERI